MERSNPLHGSQKSKHKDLYLVFFFRDPRSSACSLFFQLSIPKKQTNHHSIVERLKRPPKNLQTHPPLPRAFLFRHFSLGYWEFFKAKIGGNIAPAISIFPMILKPLKTTSVICTRTLSNLFAKKNSDSFLQA